MAVHQTGLMEPMIMLGMIDNAVAVNAANAGVPVGINYSTNNRPVFPPPQAHTVVPNTVPNHLPAQVQALQNQANTAIITQLQLQQSSQAQQTARAQPTDSVSNQTSAELSVITNTITDSTVITIDVSPTPSEPKKPRKKRAADTPVLQKPTEVKLKAKKKKCTTTKDKPKPRPKKSSDGTVSLLGKKGKTLDAQAREIALNVAEYFKREAELGRTLMPLHSYQKRAAAATGVSTATLRKLEGARREIRSERLAAEVMVEDPFPTLEIADSSFLDLTDTRHKCKKCLKSRKFFCYNCCSANPQIQDKLPKVKLPVKVDIIKHQIEMDGKSTCPHAVVLASEDVSVYTFPDIPNYDNERVVLLFPCKEANTLKEVVQTCSSSSTITVPIVSVTNPVPVSDPVSTVSNTTSTTDTGLHTPRPDQVSTAGGYADISTSSTYADLQTIWTNAYFPQPGPSASVQSTGAYTFLNPLTIYPNDVFNTRPEKQLSEEQDRTVEQKPVVVVTPPFDRAIFIDCPWNQTKTVIEDDRLKDLPRVEIRDQETKFWRCQEGLPDTYLSTIEAIYYFVRQYHEEILCNSYLNEYDNLLFFFVYFYQKVREKYRGGKEPKALQKKNAEQDEQESLV